MLLHEAAPEGGEGVEPGLLGDDLQRVVGTEQKLRSMAEPERVDVIEERLLKFLVDVVRQIRPVGPHSQRKFREREFRVQVSLFPSHVLIKSGCKMILHGM